MPSAMGSFSSPTTHRSARPVRASPAPLARCLASRRSEMTVCASAVNTPASAAPAAASIAAPQDGSHAAPIKAAAVPPPDAPTNTAHGRIDRHSNSASDGWRWRSTPVCRTAIFSTRRTRNQPPEPCGLFPPAPVPRKGQVSRGVRPSVRSRIACSDAASRPAAVQMDPYERPEKSWSARAPRRPQPSPPRATAPPAPPPSGPVPADQDQRPIAPPLTRAIRSLHNHPMGPARGPNAPEELSCASPASTTSF